MIMLTSGGKIEADEVWRTKDGVWYRRNGMVTLLKRGQVKVNRHPLTKGRHRGAAQRQFSLSLPEYCPSRSCSDSLPSTFQF